MEQFDEVCLNYFIAHQTQLFREKTVTTLEEAEEVPAASEDGLELHGGGLRQLAGSTGLFGRKRRGYKRNAFKGN